MRFATAAERALLVAPHYTVWWRVRTHNANGTIVNLANHFGYNWCESASIQQDIDASVLQAKVMLWRNVTGSDLSLAPWDEESPLNVKVLEDNSTTYAPLIDAGRRIWVDTATVPAGQLPIASDWKPLFEGEIDEVEWSSDRISLDCRDLSARVFDRFIELERDYLNPDGAPVQDVMQKILDDNMGVGQWVLHVEGDPVWYITSYRQEQTNTLEALRALAQQIGWDVRYMWNDAGQEFRLTLYEPGRTSSTTDFTFNNGVWLSVNRLAINRINVRNAIKGIISDSNDGGRRKTITVEDVDSIARYGRRYMEIGEASTSAIDTLAELQRMLDAALSDLAEPKAEKEITTLFFWPAAIGDLYRFTADGVRLTDDLDLAVVSVKHELGTKSQRTTLTCRGSVAGAYRDWIRKRATGDVPVDDRIFNVRETARDSDEVTYEWERGPGVASVLVYDRLLPEQFTEDPWPTDDTAATATLVDSDTFVTLVPPEGFIRYLQLDAINDEGTLGTRWRGRIFPAPVTPITWQTDVFETELSGLQYGVVRIKLNDPDELAESVKFYVTQAGVRSVIQNADALTVAGYEKKVLLNEKHPSIIEPVIVLTDGSFIQPGGETFDIGKIADITDVRVSYDGAEATFLVDADTDTATIFYRETYADNTMDAPVAMDVRGGNPRYGILQVTASLTTKRFFRIWGQNAAGQDGPYREVEVDVYSEPTTTVQIDVREANGIGTLRVTLIDPDNFATGVGFFVTPGSTRVKSEEQTWTRHPSQFVYEKDVVLDAKHNSYIEPIIHLLGGRDLRPGAETFDTDAVAEISTINVSYANAVATVRVNGDSDTDYIRTEEYRNGPSGLAWYAYSTQGVFTVTASATAKRLFRSIAVNYDGQDGTSREWEVDQYIPPNVGWTVDVFESAGGTVGTLRITLIDPDNLVMDAPDGVLFHVTQGSSSRVLSQGATRIDAGLKRYEKDVALHPKHLSIIEPVIMLKDGRTLQPGGETFDVGDVAEVTNAAVAYEGGNAFLIAAFDTDAVSAEYQIEDLGSTWTAAAFIAGTRMVRVQIPQLTTAARTVNVRGVNASGIAGPSVPVEVNRNVPEQANTMPYREVATETGLMGTLTLVSTTGMAGDEVTFITKSGTDPWEPTVPAIQTAAPYQASVVLVEKHNSFIRYQVRRAGAVIQESMLTFDVGHIPQIGVPIVTYNEVANTAQIRIPASDSDVGYVRVYKMVGTEWELQYHGAPTVDPVSGARVFDTPAFDRGDTAQAWKASGFTDSTPGAFEGPVATFSILPSGGSFTTVSASRTASGTCGGGGGTVVSSPRKHKISWGLQGVIRPGDYIKLEYSTNGSAFNDVSLYPTFPDDRVPAADNTFAEVQYHDYIHGAHPIFDAETSSASPGVVSVVYTYRATLYNASNFALSTMMSNAIFDRLGACTIDDWPTEEQFD